MTFFEHNIKQKPVSLHEGLKKWLLDKPYTLKSKQRETPFTLKDFKKNPNQYLFFQKLHKEFICANPKCNSTKVKCIWFEYNGIAPRVDETFAEFFCPDCNKFTFVEYYRDSS